MDKNYTAEFIELVYDCRSVEDYEGLYLVSEWGDVISLYRGKMKLLKPADNGTGYLQVVLFKNGKAKHHYVHRLVATAFCEGAGEFEDVNHIDEDKTNNYYENLEWCTRKYNANYGTRNEKISEKTKKKVRCVETGEVFNSIREAAEYIDGSPKNISDCLNGRRKTHKGYHWEYVN